MSEAGSPARNHQSRRQLRERKQRKLYSDEWALGEDDVEGVRGFSVAEKLESPKFAQTGMVREMKGFDLSIGFFQQYGFNIPLLFREKTGLGLRVPSTDFTINDVRMCVGSRRILDVMDVNTQKNIQMTMKEWQQYYEDPHKNRLLNVISLEFSHTKLDNYIQSPTVVRQMDWVDVVWPKQLKDSQVEGTNVIEEMMYPKVQKYCLMSVKNCYTDFHVDFGGTSVWYHILKGSKVFWLIPPTEKNLQLYEKWVLSGKQSDVFFGDTVEKCARVYLTAGNTFFIPTGWIHAVYTPTDTLVFGGNFLHSFGIVKQLKIAQVEDITKVPQKFRYPFFTEMLWYVLAKYVYTLLGRSHLEGEPSIEEAVACMPHVHLTHHELFGLKEIVMYLYDLPPHKKNVPELIKDPVALIKDVRTLVERHCKDKPELAITGEPVLKPETSRSPSIQIYDSNVFNDENHMHKDENVYNVHNTENIIKHEMNSPNEGNCSSGRATTDDGNFVSPTMTARPVSRGPHKKQGNTSDGGSSDVAVKSSSSQNGTNAGQPRRRRTRCKVCNACQRSDCGECSFCLDMVKFGGPGRAKQTCMMRQCLSPMLPVTAQCVYCHLDGWRQTPVSPQAKLQASLEGPSSLMECSVCYEIAHPDCAQANSQNAKGIANEDLPNSWECPSCCKSGKNNDYKPRHFRARQKSSEIRRMSVSSDASSVIESKQHIDGHHDYGMSSESDLETPSKREMKKEMKMEDIKLERMGSNSNDDNKDMEHRLDVSVIKRRKSDDGSMCSSMHDSMDVMESNSVLPRKKNTIRTQLAHQIISTSTKLLKKPQYVVRPAPLSSMSQSSNSNLTLDPTCLKAIFRYLPPETLVVCSLVCKAWSTASVDPSLWKCMNCAEHKLSAALLTAIVRRQPEHLILDWTQIAKRQLAWIISRIPGLKNLSLQNTPIQAILGLHTCLCPPLQTLDLSFVRGLNDSAIREILLPPKDSRPGLSDSKSRLRNLKTLKVAGTDISDVALRYITQGLPSLIHLDLSSCQRITDAGVAQIGTCPSAINTLVELNLSSCRLVTELSLDYLRKCEELTWLDLRHCPQVSTQAVIKFASNSKHNLQVKDVKLVDRRKVT